MATIEKKKCVICSKEFKPNWSKAVARFCSRQCAGVGKTILKERPCLTCKTMFRPVSNLKVGKYCSRKCKKKEFILRDGYRAIHRPEHQEAGPQGYVLEHRMIMDDLMGGGLTADLVVHHIDEDKHNNHINNLMALSRSAHVLAHKYSGVQYAMQ